jgi:hypothetical protein
VTSVIEHLTRQVQSSQRLLATVLAQREAIRKQDVEGVLARLNDIQTELATRQRLESERDEILGETGARLGIAAEHVQLDDVLSFMSAADAQRARALSGELRGLLVEIGRVHSTNRVLIRQELTFLDHLMRVLSGVPQGAYSANGYTPQAPVPQARRTLDAMA